MPVKKRPKPSSVESLKALLARREHQAFLDELLLALEDADCWALDYLAALGGEGLHVLLRGDGTVALWKAYADLLLEGKIHAPSSLILALYQREPSPDLLELADKTESRNRVPEKTSSHSQAATHSESPPIQFKRVVQIMDMSFGSYSASDSLGLRRSVFRSEQERTFLQALSLAFPGLHALPNYPLDQLADFDKLQELLDSETLEYGKLCRINAVLVIPGEGDPVAGFALAVRRNDEPAQARLARLRNRLFRVLQIPLFTLQVEQDLFVGVDEWYALITSEVTDKVHCGRRIRSRASHPTLIPI